MKRVLTEGFLAGALGYLVVASFFAVANLAAGDSMFRTAYLLGEAVGAGTGGIGDAAGIVLAANGIHLVVSMLLGLCAAWVVMEVEHHHTFWYVAFIALFGGGWLALGIAGLGTGSGAEGARASSEPLRHPGDPLPGQEEEGWEPEEGPEPGGLRPHPALEELSQAPVAEECEAA